MKKLVLLLCALAPMLVVAQPLVRSFPFTMLSRDTTRSADLPMAPDEVAGAKGRIGVSSEGHFQTPDGKRVRFFGTELNYGANFLDGTDARALAGRFKKLGINAVRINYIDHSAYGGASLISYDPNNSYVVDQAAFARLDTLIYEFSQAGIYSILTLQTIHYYWKNDGVAWWPDSLPYPSYLLDYVIDNRARQLQRDWAKTVLGHINTINHLRYADDPAIAAVEINGTGVNGAYNFPLTAAWRYDWLNFQGPTTSTLTFHRSRRLDTLYTEYLLRKYGSQAGINAAWQGGTVNNPPNLVENASFEQPGSAVWSFVTGNGATGAPALLSPGKDSDFCAWLTISNLSSNPQAGDMYYYNLSTRCGKDTLYELRFWSKVRYSAQHPYTNRQLYTVVTPYNNSGPAAVGQTVDIDTTWREFVIPFRATASGLQYLIFYVGAQLGDVLLDGIKIRRLQETGLFPGENTAQRMIVRTPYGRVAQVSYNRVRDISLFYDSLQRSFYKQMISVIHDSIKSQVLVNAFPSWYYSSALEPYGNTVSDFAQSYINTDYMQARPNIPYSDSTWMISNNTPMRDAGNYPMGLVASQSLEGKPMIVNWINPTMNQHYASMLPYITGYASLQDWDGLFFSQYATYREVLFADSLFPATGGYSTYYDIAGNPSLIGQFPVMSEIFRTARIKPAENYVLVDHTKDDMELLPTIADYRHPFNVEGYLDPNIATNFKMRQRYNAPTHKVAAVYPYVPDSSVKLSDTRELSWSQSSGHFIGVGATAAFIGGIFGEDTVKLGDFAVRRLDKLHDPIALSLVSRDSMPLGRSALTFMTIAGRGQNTAMAWVDSFGFGKHWGSAPTVMSAPTLELFLRSDRQFVYVHAIDEMGNRKEHGSAQLVEPGSHLFKYTLDPSQSKSMWYTIEQTDVPSTVRQEPGVAQTFDLRVYPNPSKAISIAAVDITEDADVRLSLYDALGREVVRLANDHLTAGKYLYDLDVTTLPAGRYLLAGDLGAHRLVRSVTVVK